ncbi:MAG: helix-turn-helix domain-containing protein [Tannerella sp.]|jgi:excisionase family DNA binding protein|nr:helix-turn-helix domain-containing protein [Tannerella sp.]
MEEKILDQLSRIERNSLLSAKNVLTFEDVALLTGLSKSHLYKLTCSHQIPHYKPNGKQIYFDRLELENWMKQNRVSTSNEIDKMATDYIVTGNIGRVSK